MYRRYRINAYDNAIIERMVESANTKSIRWVNERGQICTERKNSIYHGYYETKQAALIALKIQWKRDVDILKSELKKKTTLLNEVVNKLELDYDL